jgi:hypothetical protein
VGEVTTEDSGVEVDQLEATRWGMALHSGGFMAAHIEWGGAPVRGSFGSCGGQLGAGRSVATVGNSLMSRRARTVAG